MKCKKCKIKDGAKYSKYASGEFCSKECARGFSTLEKRGDINKKVSEKLKELTPLKAKGYTCSKCEKDFETTRRFRTNRKPTCDECKRSTEAINIEDADSILKLSARTVQKVLKRAKVKCMMCGWDETSLDIHHILGRKFGGGDEHDNLIALCPNCHRKAHEKKYSIEELKKKNFSVMFKEWKNYYNIVN